MQPSLLDQFMNTVDYTGSERTAHPSGAFRTVSHDCVCLLLVRLNCRPDVNFVGDMSGVLKSETEIRPGNTYKGFVLDVVETRPFVGYNWGSKP
jgi:hypothetical protein